MKLEELKKQAQAILDLKVTEGYEHISFTTNSGGLPAIKVEFTDEVISRLEEPKYNTPANGMAYSSETVILCKNTGIKDKNDRLIYVTPNDVTFVYAYSGGSPYCFDSASFRSPNI
jgi:hypothetical protein